MLWRVKVLFGIFFGVSNIKKILPTPETVFLSKNITLISRILPENLKKTLLARAIHQIRVQKALVKRLQSLKNALLNTGYLRCSSSAF